MQRTKTYAKNVCDSLEFNNYEIAGTEKAPNFKGGMRIFNGVTVFFTIDRAFVIDNADVKSFADFKNLVATRKLKLGSVETSATPVTVLAEADIVAAEPEDDDWDIPIYSKSEAYSKYNLSKYSVEIESMLTDLVLAFTEFKTC